MNSNKKNSSTIILIISDLRLPEVLWILLSFVLEEEQVFMALNLPIMEVEEQVLDSKLRYTHTLNESSVNTGCRTCLLILPWSLKLL